MEARKRVRTETTVEIKLSDWEARDVVKILDRLSANPKMRISEFTLREKATGRRLRATLKELS